MRTDELDFHLPPELIAQVPSERREQSRLLHYRRASREVSHRRFGDLPQLLRAGDLLVLNDARVVPARFSLQKPTGGHVEGLFLTETSPGEWGVMLRNLGAFRDSTELHFLDAPQWRLKVLEKDAEGFYRVQLSPPDAAQTVLGQVGRMPLPPYIRRQRDHDPRDAFDRQRYQTVYAHNGSAVAAPTAGLHFTPEIIAQLLAAGLEITTLTLNVGIGTFKPITSDLLEEHPMHVESYSISPAAAETLNRAKADKRRIIAVGTTSARVLESQPVDRPFEPRDSQTGIFIYPPYRWRHVSAMITNFHLPRSTLIALVAAMISLEEQRRLYSLAIAHKYRFFSYGDAMLLE